VKGGKILVIDDEPMVREAVGRVLLGEGYAVAFAHDGNDAIGKLRSDRPDAILLDLMMPGMNGRQFLSALRTELGLDLPVVVMTAVHGLGQRAISLGATDVVEKPFDVDELLNKVALAVFRSRQTELPTTPADAAHRASEIPSGEDSVVVVIDHDLGALGRLDALLSGAGFTVVAVPRITDQLPRLLRALSPSAVVLAVDATDDGGAEVTATIRSTPGLADVPLLAFTRAGDSRAAMATPVVSTAAVTLARPGDDDLLRTVELMSNNRRPRPKA